MATRMENRRTGERRARRMHDLAWWTRRHAQMQEMAMHCASERMRNMAAGEARLASARCRECQERAMRGEAAEAAE